MPKTTLKALAEQTELGSILPVDGGGSEAALTVFVMAGIDVDKLATQLQDEGASAFVKSWNELMEVIESRSSVIRRTVQVA